MKILKFLENNLLKTQTKKQPGNTLSHYLLHHYKASSKHDEDQEVRNVALGFIGNRTCNKQTGCGGLQYLS